MIDGDPEQLCIYCQQCPGNTVDEVVARCFFGSMPPSHFVKVPACRQCNSGTGDGGPWPISRDEEYVRTLLASEHNSCQHPVAAKLWTEEISRSVERNPSLFRRIGTGARRVEARTESGIVIPNAPALTVETERVSRVLRKIVRGLYYTINDQRPLPVGTPIICSRQLSAEHFGKYNEKIDRLQQSTEWWNIGDEKAFQFRSGMDSLGSTESVWLLMFYQAVAFVTFTGDYARDVLEGPKGSLQRSRTP